MVTEEEFKKGLKQQENKVQAKWTEYLTAFNTKMNNGNQYYAINIKDANIGSKGQIGGNNLKLNSYNVDDGLSLSELKMLDKNGDGLLTKEEFKDGLWNLYTAASDNNEYDSTDIRFMDNKNGYYDQTIKEATEEFMGGKTSLNEAEFIDVIKNQLHIEISDDIIKNAFTNINRTMGTLSMQTKSLATLFALADIGSSNIENYEYGVKIDFMDGKFSHKDMEDILTKLASNTTSTTKYKNMFSDLNVRYIDAAFKTKKIDIGVSDANGNTKEAEKQNDTINNYKNTQNKANAIVNQKIQLYTKQMNDLLAKIQLEMDAIDTKVSDGKTKYGALEKKYTEIKEKFEAQIDSLKKESISDDIKNSTNVMVAQFEFTQVKKGQLGNSSSFRNEISSGIMAKLKDFLENYVSNKDVENVVTIENGEAKIKETFKNKLNELKNQAESLMNKYPEMARDIKEFLNGHIDSLTNRITSNISEEIEKAQRVMNQNINNNLNIIRNENRQRTDKDIQDQINDEAVDTSTTVDTITNATKTYVDAFAAGNTKIQELNNYTKLIKKEIDELEV